MIQLNAIGNDNGDITSNPTEIQKKKPKFSETVINTSMHTN